MNSRCTHTRSHLNPISIARIQYLLSKTSVGCFILVALTICAGSTNAQTEETRKQDEADTSAFFEKAHAALDEALDMFDDQKQLPGQEDLAFYDFLSRTKESQQEKIEGYLDEAAAALGISEISKRRDNIARLRVEIQETRSDLTVFQRKRISAPESKGYNPLTVTKTGYDTKIEAALVEQVEMLMAEDAAQAQSPKNYGKGSRFATVLCQQVDRLS